MGGVGRGVKVAVVALAIGGSIAPAQAASGLEPGVHVDPGSPAAKEYALPLNQARQTGATSPSQVGTSNESTLFGAGIKPPNSGGPPHAGKRGGQGTAAGGSQTGATGAT